MESMNNEYWLYIANPFEFKIPHNLSLTCKGKSTSFFPCSINTGRDKCFAVSQAHIVLSSVTVVLNHVFSHCPPRTIYNSYIPPIVIVVVSWDIGLCSSNNSNRIVTSA